MSKLQLQFNPDLPHQRLAIDSVVNVFDGFSQPLPGALELDNVISNVPDLEGFDPL